MKVPSPLVVLVSLLLGAGCASPADTVEHRASSAAPAASLALPVPTAAASATAAGPERAAEAAPTMAGDPQGDDAAARRRRFDRIANELSEPDAEFFSDNIVSNETSYLQVADRLPSAARAGGVYLGVGPEQNFTYIALTRPSLAVIVDIRRQNLLLHLLYKAAFEAAVSRSHFVSLMLGRPHRADQDEKAQADVPEVLALATHQPASEASFEADHETLLLHVRTYGVNLSGTDLEHLRAVHRTLFEGQLATRFSLKANNGRRYPTIEELWTARSPDGRAGGFLASDQTFRAVQTLEREDRIAFVVGDFAGDKALPGLARLLTEEKRAVSTFYVSNVEQYLLDPPVWAKWLRNVAALPSDADSLFVRCYLDQGKKHPLEMSGHRTATVLQRFSDFEEHFGATRTATLWALSTSGLLDDAKPR